MYLPLELNSPLLAGALVAHFVARSARGDAALAKARGERGTLLASGLIAGGALAGVLKGLTDVVEQEVLGRQVLPRLANLESAGNWLGLAVFVAMGVGVYLDARRTRPAA
jgi:hypothetical protein